ncbi:MAG: preprotein translocase subunit YajC [Verrucomicrobiota bacterium]
MNMLSSLSLDGMLFAASQGGTPPIFMLGYFAIFGVMFYFLLIRPQQKKMKEHQELVNSVKSGDRVVAAGGIHGTVTNVKDATVMLKISEQVKIEVDKASISLVNPEN